jgi:hypothetical protein
MYTESIEIMGGRPAVSPAAAGEVIVADGTLEVTAGQIAVNDLVGLVILPAFCVPLDFILIEDDLDTGAALVQDVGVLNADKNGLVSATNFITGTTIGRAGGSLRATALPDALIAPSATDRIIAVKTTTGGVLPVKATCKVTSDENPVTPTKVVVVNGKTYTFVASSPTSEGDVLAGANAAASLANLAAAILREDPDTDDGVLYKGAAAHATVGVKSVTSTVLTLEALAAGSAGNAYTCTTDDSSLTVDVAEFDGGVTAVPLQGGTIRGILSYRAEEYDG